MLDRMALAMSSESVEAALYDMLRLIDSLYARKIRVKLKTTEDQKDYTLNCCEYDGELGYGIKGVVEEVYEPVELKNKYEGKPIYCVPCPPKPYESEIRDFLSETEKDPSLARRIVLLSYGFRGGRD